MKGGTIIVGGGTGAFTGFMMQRGRMVICGDAGKNLGDSMYDGTIYIGGKTASLGVDAVWAEMTDLDRQWLERKLRLYDMDAQDGIDNMPKIVGRQAAVELRQSRADGEEARPLAIGSDAMSDRRSTKKDKKTGNGTRAPAESKPFILGQSQIFTPEVIDDIHIKSELGRYRMRGFSLFKKIPHWDDLTFLPGTLTRFVIEGYREKCETKTVIGPRAKRPMELDIPVYITGMSFGALSYEAKIALARGATMAGSATCSGEGGMIPDERRYSRSGSTSASSRATASTRITCGWPTPASSSSARAARSASAAI